MRVYRQLRRYRYICNISGFLSVISAVCCVCGLALGYKKRGLWNLLQITPLVLTPYRLLSSVPQAVFPLSEASNAFLILWSVPGAFGSIPAGTAFWVRRQAVPAFPVLSFGNAPFWFCGSHVPGVHSVQTFGAVPTVCFRVCLCLVNLPLCAAYLTAYKYHVSFTSDTIAGIKIRLPAAMRTLFYLVIAHGRFSFCIIYTMHLSCISCAYYTIEQVKEQETKDSKAPVNKGFSLGFV